MLISSPAVEKEWGWGNGLSNPWQMRGFQSKEWPWEFSVGQTRLRSKAGILFSVGSGRRFASSRSQPGLSGLPPTAPAPASPSQGREGEGRPGSPGPMGWRCPEEAPLQRRAGSRCRTPRPALQIPACFLSAPCMPPPPQLTLQLDSQPSSTSSVTSVSYLPLWASVSPTVCDKQNLSEGCVTDTGSRNMPPSTSKTGSSAPPMQTPVPFPLF